MQAPRAPRKWLWHWHFQNYELEFLPALESLQAGGRCPGMGPGQRALTFWPHMCTLLPFLLPASPLISFSSPFPPQILTTPSKVSPEMQGQCLQWGERLVTKEPLNCLLVNAYGSFLFSFPFPSLVFCPLSSPRQRVFPTLLCSLGALSKSKTYPLGRRLPPSAISLSRLPSRAFLRSELKARKQREDVFPASCPFLHLLKVHPKDKRCSKDKVDPSDLTHQQ